jgi:shikimate dehydrogenase
MRDLHLLHTAALNGQTDVFGIIGYPLAHSASPGMHARGYKIHHLNAVYVPFPVTDVANLSAALAGIRALSIKGINVTVPYKEAVIPFLDKVDPVAAQMGAVNTIVNESGTLIGYNTDGDGFVLSLYEECAWEPAGKSVAIIGAGGSARGIAFALCRSGISQLHLYSRTAEKTAALCATIQAQYPSVCVRMSEGVFFDAEADLVIQTTPVGMQGKYEGMLPVADMSWVSAHQIIVDIVYKPSVTVFMAAARGAAGVFGGAGMLAGQGLLAYQLFTKKEIPYQIMKEALE